MNKLTPAQIRLLALVEGQTDDRALARKWKPTLKTEEAMIRMGMVEWVSRGDVGRQTNYLVATPAGKHELASTRNRVMGPARRRNAPSTMFHAVVDRGGGQPGMFQPEIVGSDPSLSTVRVRAKIAADSSGLPVAVMDDHHKVIKVYRPTTDTVRSPRT